MTDTHTHDQNEVPVNKDVPKSVNYDVSPDELIESSANDKESNSRNENVSKSVNYDVSSEVISALSNTNRTQKIEPILHHVMKGCELVEVDPASCIPLHLSHSSSENGMKTIKAVLTGRNSQNVHRLPGLVAGTPTSIVVPIVAHLSELITNHLMDSAMTEEDAQDCKKSKPVWFGIVDGCLFHGAVMELRTEQPSKWKRFNWNVVKIRPNKSLREYRQLSRLQNVRNSSAHHFDLTTYDLLHELRKEHDHLYEMAKKSSRTGNVKVAHRDVAHAKDGGEHKIATYLKQAVSVASRLARETIDVLGFVCNSEHPYVVLNDVSLNTSGAKNEMEAISNRDCRLFKSFICFGAIRAAKSFMSALADGNVSAQVNTIYRLKHFYERHQYKPIQSRIVIDQFDMAICALTEEEKFLKFISATTWPTSMETIKINVLQTTLCDDELSQNRGNDTDVLPCVWKCFERLFPSKAKAIISSHQQIDQPSDTVSVSVTPATSTYPTECVEDVNKEAEAEAERKLIEEEKRTEEERLSKLIGMRKKADDILSKRNIKTYDLTWSEFSTQILKDTFPRVDAIISEACSSDSIDDLRKFPSFCTSVLKSGAYIFLIVSQYQLTVLQEVFGQNGFKVMPFAFQILYIKECTKRRSLSDFRQKPGDTALLAKAPGNHPDGFRPDFLRTDDIKFSSASWRGASIVYVPPCTEKLKPPTKNSPLQPSERSTVLYLSLLDVLVPAEGVVMDPWSGAMKLARTCLDTQHGCIILECSDECYRYAVGRLRIFATPGATMENLEEYADPKRDATANNSREKRYV